VGWDPGFLAQNVRVATSIERPRIVVGQGRVELNPSSWVGVSLGDAAMVVEEDRGVVMVVAVDRVAVDAGGGIGLDKGERPSPRS
jgi:hypothetical protein